MSKRTYEVAKIPFTTETSVWLLDESVGRVVKRYKYPNSGYDYEMNQLRDAWIKGDYATLWLIENEYEPDDLEPQVLCTQDNCALCWNFVPHE